MKFDKDMIVIVLMLLTLLSFYYIVIYIPKRRWQKSPVYRNVTDLDKMQLQDLHEDLEKLYLKLTDFSRDVQAKLDTKIALLNKLLVEADKRIEKIEELKKSLEVNLAVNTEKEIKNREIEGREENSLGSDEIKRVSGEKNEILRDEMVHEEVYNLHKQGFSLNEISQRVGLSIDSINLILSLRTFYEKNKNK